MDDQLRCALASLAAVPSPNKIVELLSVGGGQTEYLYFQKDTAAALS